jgi:hypothetical protein
MTEPVCNCKDEFRVELCQVHDIPEEGQVGEESGSGYLNGGIVLQDNNLVSIEPNQWVGHCFECTNCGGHVMQAMNYCPNCGIMVDVKSKIVTAYINKLANQRKINRERGLP